MYDFMVFRESIATSQPDRYVYDLWLVCSLKHRRNRSDSPNVPRFLASLGLGSVWVFCAVPLFSAFLPRPGTDRKFSFVSSRQFN